MVKLRHLFFYTLACLAFPAAALMFVFNKPLSALFIRSSKIEIAPIYTGGKVVEIIDHENYKTFVHEPLSKNCFSSEYVVQIDWETKEGNSFPGHIREELPTLGIIIDWETTKKEAQIINSSITILSPIYVLSLHKKMIRLIFDKKKDAASTQVQNN